MSGPVFTKLVGIMYQVNKCYWKRMHGPSFENKMYPLSENSVHLVTYNADEIMSDIYIYQKLQIT